MTNGVNSANNEPNGNVKKYIKTRTTIVHKSVNSIIIVRHIKANNYSGSLDQFRFETGFPSVYYLGTMPRLVAVKTCFLEWFTVYHCKKCMQIQNLHADPSILEGRHFSSSEWDNHASSIYIYFIIKDPTNICKTKQFQADLGLLIKNSR